MAATDRAGMLARLRALLPRGWYPDEATALDAALSGPAEMWAWTHALLTWARAQIRVRTATGSFLDAAARDFFGVRVRRRRGQGDDAFRRRVLAELFRERGTRAGVIRALTDLTGVAPTVFEPADPRDAKGWNTAAAGYAVAGGWGSLAYPAQSFITAHRPREAGLPKRAGYSTSAAGWGTGPLEWGSLARAQDVITDADIHAAVAAVKPAGTVAWVRILP